jgi:hypothetical protein
MNIKNICTKKSYQSNGQEKTFWPIVGSLKTTDEGKIFIELNMFPQTAFYVFDRKEKEAPASNGQVDF